MRVFIAFLIGSFFVGGTVLGRPLRDRPIVFLAGCAVVGAMFYSLRVVR